MDTLEVAAKVVLVLAELHHGLEMAVMEDQQLAAVNQAALALVAEAVNGLTVE